MIEQAKDLLLVCKLEGHFGILGATALGGCDDKSSFCIWVFVWHEFGNCRFNDVAESITGSFSSVW